MPHDEIPPGTLYMLILRTLTRRGELHGYEIARGIHSASREVLHVEEGSLYPALQRMMAKGWVTAACGDDPPRRPRSGPVCIRNRRPPAGGQPARLAHSAVRHGRPRPAPRPARPSTQSRLRGHGNRVTRSRIGANFAIFGAVYSTLLDPLPYEDPQQLVWLSGRNPSHGWLRWWRPFSLREERRLDPVAALRGD